MLMKDIISFSEGNQAETRNRVNRFAPDAQSPCQSPDDTFRTSQIMQPACEPFSSTLHSLHQERQRAIRSSRSTAHASKQELPRIAVCLQGQLRLFMVGFPTLIRNLLLPALADHQLDFFYVGPADESFAQGKAYLQQLPGLRAMTLYEPRLRWQSSAAHQPLAKLLHTTNRSQYGPSTTSQQLPIARFDVHQLRGCGPLPRLQSWLVQALQSYECLRLIKVAEASPRHRRRVVGRTSTTSTASSANGATTGPGGNSSNVIRARRRRSYAGVLRLRADVLPLRPLSLPTLSSGQRVFTSFAACERGHGPTAPLAPHDYALYGEREVMGTVLGAVGSLTASELKRSGCDVHAAAAGRLRTALPDARCVVTRGRNGTAPLASVRGSVSTPARDGHAAAGCFFLDQEHPPNDAEAQPRLQALFPGAERVATECLSIAELRDGRRPGSGPACVPAGGWDGDFRDGGRASPWLGKPNLGAG